MHAVRGDTLSKGPVTGADARNEELCDAELCDAELAPAVREGCGAPHFAQKRSVSPATVPQWLQ